MLLNKNYRGRAASTSSERPCIFIKGRLSDIMQKGGRGSSSNYFFECLRNDKLQ